MINERVVTSMEHPPIRSRDARLSRPHLLGTYAGGGEGLMRRLFYIFAVSFLVYTPAVGGVSLNTQPPLRVGLLPDAVQRPFNVDVMERPSKKPCGQTSLTQSGDSPTPNGDRGSYSHCVFGMPGDLDVASIERSRVIAAAGQYLKEKPITITATSSSRSAGGRHDFFSEGDYWWPDPKNPEGPYIQKDGMTNPDNFVEHRRAMMRLSVHVPALAAAWVLTGKGAYADKAAEHLRAWFIAEATRMNPSLQYAQAIHGVTTGRGTGIIDTIHLVEVARAVEILEGSGSLSKFDITGIKGWFSEYLRWLNTSKNGTDERDAKNNHGTCWVMQAAAFAHLTGDQEMLAWCRDRFKTVLVPGQIETDGSFPQELRRTKPYNYSLFNLEAMTTICQILSTAKDDLWRYKAADGRGIGAAVAYMHPFIRDKRSWTRPADVMYFDDWPMRQSSLLFAGLALHKPEYIDTWRKLPADSTVEEVIRNFFIRQPVLWVGKSAGKV